MMAVKVQPQKQKGEPATKPKAFASGTEHARTLCLCSGCEVPCSMMHGPSTAVQGERAGWGVRFQPFCFQQFKLTLSFLDFSSPF